MSQKNNETLPLILSLLITLGLLLGGLWWFAGRFAGLTGALSPDSGETVPSGDPKNRLSMGERLIFPEGASAEKQAAVQAIASRNDSQAIAALEASLKARRNDPEALIYLNNARIGEQTSYTIAVPVPVTTDVNGSLEILRGVAQAQSEVNQAGGINGVPLKVVIANDDNNPAVAQQVARSLVENSAVLGVVGHYSSDVTLAAAQVYQASGLVAISPVSTSVKLSNYGDFIFRSVPSDFVAARSLSDYALTRLKRQQAAVFFNSQSGYSQSIKSEFGTALALGGGQVVSEFDLSDPAFSPSRSLEQAVQQGATVLALLPNTGQLDRALQVVQLNQGRLPLLGGDDVYTPRTLEVGQATARGMIVAVPWHILANPQAPFVQSSRQLWGGDVNWRTVTAYDATQALIGGLRRAPSRKGVQQVLRDAAFSTEGATEGVRFLPSGDRNQPVQLVEIQPGRRSGYGYDFVPIPR